MFNAMSTHTFLRFTAPVNNCFCRETAAVLDFVGKDGVSWADKSALASRSTIRAYKGVMYMIDMKDQSSDNLGLKICTKVS